MWCYNNENVIETVGKLLFSSDFMKGIYERQYILPCVPKNAFLYSFGQFIILTATETETELPKYSLHFFYKDRLYTKRDTIKISNEPAKHLHHNSVSMTHDAKALTQFYNTSYKWLDDKAGIVMSCELPAFDLWN